MLRHNHQNSYWHYHQYDYLSENQEPGNRNRLHTYSLSAMLLGFLDLIEEIFLFFSYNGVLKCSFEANHLTSWWYSRMSFGWPVDEVARYRSKFDYFEPFKFNYTFRDKPERVIMVEEVFSELLLEFRYEDDFKINPRILNEYLGI